jgi:hypothetical protein
MRQWSSARPCLQHAPLLVAMPSVARKAHEGKEGKGVISANVKKTPVKAITFFFAAGFNANRAAG